MKDRIWLLQLPVIALFSFGFLVTEYGVRGDLENKFLREAVFPRLKTFSTALTDIKFKIRGPQPPREKIVIVEVDSAALEKVGRWPWHRDATAYLIEKTFAAGAKVVGLDMVFSEPDQRIPHELGEVLKAQNLGALIETFETDFALSKVVDKYKDRLVLGYTTETACQPRFDKPEECPVTNPDAIATHPAGFEKFAFTHFEPTGEFHADKTAISSIPTFIANIPLYNEPALHAGYFNAFLDPDGYVRRTSMMMFANGKPYPSLPLEMARVGLGEELRLKLDADERVASVELAKSGRKIPVSDLGAMEVNFRGPGRTFTYVPALDVMSDNDHIEMEVNRKLASFSKTDLLKDAYVLIGISALGVFDMRSFPFESNVPGVEGHANILDNLLAGDPMVYGGGEAGFWTLLLLMTLGALLFSFLTQKLEAVPALLLFVFIMAAAAVGDQKLLFENDHDWNTAFLGAELFTIFVLTVAVKYVLEERNKKFIRGAFSRYVAPAVVDSVLKDPTKLTVGGIKRELTIMFSDIRGFTTFSERMDAKALATFLNDYLGLMTDLVFDHNGTLDKYIGDAVMAFWGAPLEQPKHAHNACLCAVHMLQTLDKHRDRFKSEYGVEVQIGIGINSGAVNVGNMGSSRIFEYTVIGDHVNLASRLEGLTKFYGVGIVTTRFSFDFIAQAGDPMPPHRTLDFVKVKGKKKAVELIQVIERDLKSEGLALFEKGRLLYTERKWDEAIETFKQANAILARSPEEADGPCEVYIERCAEFKATPPEADWDGSYVMTSK